MNEYLVRLSKTVAHALRHQPEEYGLELDEEGWVPVASLLAALHTRGNSWQRVSVADLEKIIANSEKQRFEMRAGKIRAFYGHSTAEKIEKQAVPPPPILYHGTTQQAVTSIRRGGLQAMKRQYVHLSTNEKTAHQVALRRTQQPVILQIAALRAHEQGIRFYQGNEDIWLADAIPPTFITFPTTRS